MSILQIELSDETRAQVEQLARNEGCDAASWMVHLVESQLKSSREQGKAQQEFVKAELLKAVNSPAIEATPEWWEEFTKETMERVDAQSR